MGVGCVCVNVTAISGRYKQAQESLLNTHTHIHMLVVTASAVEYIIGFILYQNVCLPNCSFQTTTYTLYSCRLRSGNQRMVLDIKTTSPFKHY